MALYNITQEDCTGNYLCHTANGIKVLPSNKVLVLDIESFEAENYEALMDLYVEDREEDRLDWWDFVKQIYLTNNRGSNLYSNIVWIIPLI